MMAIFAHRAKNVKYDLPAITIPFENHRALRTTGTRPAAKKFHQKLIELCNEDKIDEALVRCFKEYKDKQIDLKLVPVEESLDLYKKIGVLDDKQIKNIYDSLFLDN